MYPFRSVLFNLKRSRPTEATDFRCWPLASDFVIDAGALTDIDFSAGRTFRDLLAELKARQIDVVMGRVSTDLRADLERHGIVEARRRENLPRAASGASPCQVNLVFGVSRSLLVCYPYSSWNIRALSTP
jgi:hypothetical protein